MQTITVSQLKTHLSSEIKKLKKSGGIEIVQRDVPVARLLPIDESNGLRYHSQARAKFRFIKPVVELTSDPVDILLEDRRKERV